VAPRSPDGARRAPLAALAVALALLAVAPPRASAQPVPVVPKSERGGFDSERAFGQNYFGDASPEGYAWWAAFVLELLMTAIFVGVILAVTDARQPHATMAPLAIGLTLAVIHFASMRATGTSVNPARSIGAGLFAGAEAIRQLDKILDPFEMTSPGIAGTDKKPDRPWWDEQEGDH